MGRLTSAANGSDTVTRTYDLAGRLRKEQSSARGSTVEYTYKADGTRDTLLLNGAEVVRYGLDTTARQQTLRNAGNLYTIQVVASTRYRSRLDAGDRRPATNRLRPRLAALARTVRGGWTRAARRF